MRRLVLLLVGAIAAVSVAGASAADFDIDNGPCRETPGDAFLLRCPTAYVGVPYEVQIESEEGSGCSPNYDWFEIVNSALPAGLSMTRDGLISGVPTSAGFTRFWIWNHDLSVAQGGPDWCLWDDRSEREFSISVDPGLAIDNQTLNAATIGQAYSQTLTAKRVTNLNPLTGTAVQATWSLQSGALPPGVALSTQGLITGTPTSEGSYRFVVKAENGGPFVTKEYTVGVRQPVIVTLPFGSTQRPGAEVGIRLTKNPSATGGTGTYTWSLTSGALPGGVTLDPGKGTLSGAPQAAGSFAFGVTATDDEGRVATANATLRVAPKLAIKTLRVPQAKLGRAYRARLVTVGGVQRVVWKVLGGQLPHGVRFSTSLGTLAGTPRRPGTFRLSIEARDALGAKAQRKLVLGVTS